ncbi:MAG: aldo/keto reductase [Actinomycetota bacterium]
MEHRAIGNLKVSVVGLGCNNFGARCDESQTGAVVNAALDSGINFFDTADVYGGTLSEEYLGKALALRRDEVVIATKFGNPLSEPESGGQSARWIARAIEGSLRRLGTDRVDLYQLHIPAGDAPMEETLEALNRLVAEGKVLEIGCSNFSNEQVDESVGISDQKSFPRWASAQNHYNLLFREAEENVLPACRRHQLGFLPYFPLAHGLLTGKYRRGETPPPGTRLAGAPEDRRSRILNERNFEVVEKLEAFAAERGHSLLELAISWLAAQSQVASVIAGATKPEQAEANAAAASWKVDDATLRDIDQITSS